MEKESADAVDASRAVLKGKIAEQLAPLLPGFLAKYNPADARFIGSPIDYLIFRNMSRGKDSDDPIGIVLLDVKTGKAGLNGVQKRIEAAAASKRVSFDVLRTDMPSASGLASKETGGRQLELDACPMSSGFIAKSSFPGETLWPPTDFTSSACSSCQSNAARRRHVSARCPHFSANSQVKVRAFRPSSPGGRPAASLRPARSGCLSRSLQSPAA